MLEELRLEDQAYIVAASPPRDRTLVLKQGDTFGVFDPHGDVRPVGLGEQGLYHAGTRYLSRLTLRLGTERPLLLSSSVREDNLILTVDLTNPDVLYQDTLVLPRGTVHLRRRRFLWQNVCYEELRVQNYGLEPVNVTFHIEFEADFADIFEVRGLRRQNRGLRLPNTVEAGEITMAYEGLDGVLRSTRLRSSPAPDQVTDNEMRFRARLDPQEDCDFLLSASCEAAEERRRAVSFGSALDAAERGLHEVATEGCRIQTTNAHFDEWMTRAQSDLRMMITRTPWGVYPYAGVPWFSTPFGRDGLLTAIACLWARPNVARGVLAYLAATQATELVPERDAEPGKILHESRSGEMAALGEVPFARYYGSVDATPLFVLLAGEYWERTDDDEFIDDIWPNIERALEWMDTYGDGDRDGFVEYFKRSERGLIQQGWKDSHDSVFHADGTMAEAPIALCEVQGYAYAARRKAAAMATAIGLEERARRLDEEARRLKDRFEQEYWIDDLGTYALALDGRKRPCRVRTSNAGHCLFTGIVDARRARILESTLMDPASFSGWGIRTVAAGEARYNPMSYHNGSVWPHDTALVAAGLSRYGFKDSVLRVTGALLDASIHMDLHRLPELYCGFERRPGKGPTLYPIACSPQAWASAAIFWVLQSCLGLNIHARENRVCFHRPRLPEWMKQVSISDLRVQDAVVDLELQRYAQGVGINVTRREGSLEVVAIE